jgi:hypothetical protein
MTILPVPAADCLQDRDETAGCLGRLISTCTQCSILALRPHLVLSFHNILLVRYVGHFFNATLQPRPLM